MHAFGNDIGHEFVPNQVRLASLSPAEREWKSNDSELRVDKKAGSYSA